MSDEDFESLARIRQGMKTLRTEAEQLDEKLGVHSALERPLPARRERVLPNGQNFDQMSLGEKLRVIAKGRRVTTDEIVAGLNSMGHRVDSIKAISPYIYGGKSCLKRVGRGVFTAK